MLVCELKTARAGDILQWVGRAACVPGFLTLVSLGSAAVSVPVPAQDLAPGLWEIALETQVPAASGFAPGPLKLTQCVTAADARDPSGLLGGLSNPGATGCTYSDKSYAGNTFRFSLRCAGAFAIQSRGEVAFSANWMEGTISTTAVVSGVKTETKNRVSARRLGGC
ncbi:MAG: DUF3617 family protein [Betaproteobacteria bacterium]|nr:DUF3617 family protein [Betaproteobacteria bacterium]